MEFFRVPEPHRHAARRPPHGPSRRPRQPAGSRRFRYWRASPRPAQAGRSPAVVRSASRSSTPATVTGTMPTDPSRRNWPPASTEACSMAETISRSTGARRCPAQARRQRQRIGLGAARREDRHCAARAPTAAATAARASSTSRRAARPSAWMDDGFPARSQRRRHRLPRLAAQRRGRIPVEINARLR